MNKKQLQLENEKLHKRLDEVEEILNSISIPESNAPGSLSNSKSLFQDKEINAEVKHSPIEHENIDFFSNTAIQFMEFPHNNDIYEFVGEQIRNLAGKDSYVAVNSVDIKTGVPTIHSIMGIGKLAPMITRTLGRTPVGMKFFGKDPNRHYHDGKLHVYKEGLYGILFKTVAKNICRSIEKSAGIKKIYVIDLVKQKRFFGSVVIFSKENTAELKNKNFIELFVKQASIAILKNQAEEKLHINDEKLNNIISSSPIGICTVDHNGNFISTNSAYEKMLGYSKEELSELSFFEITHPDDRPENKKLFQEMFSLQTSGFSIEKKYIRKDDTIIDVSVHANCVKDSDGKVRFGTAFVEDITKRKSDREALIVSEKRYRDAQRIGHVGNWEYNPVRSVFWTSDEAKRIFGFDLKKQFFSTENIENCIIKREEVHQALMDLVDHDKKYDLIYDILTEDNSIHKTIHSIAKTERDDLGSPLIIRGVISDITERMQTESKLKESESKFRTIWEKGTDGMRITDAEGNVILVNEAYCKIVEKTRKEIEGKPLSTIYEEFKKEDILRKHCERFRSRNIPAHLERELVLWNGRRIFLSLSNSFIKIQSGTTVSLSIMRDITERKQAEEKINIQVNKWQTTFNAMSDSVSIIDLDGNILQYNSTTLSMFDITEEKIKGKNASN